MKTILVFVSTLDGKVTRWDNPDVKSWSSVSDQEYFRKIWNSSSHIIMGSNTFSADPIKPSPSRLLTVVTSHPGDFRQFIIKDQIEFTNEAPSEIISRLNSQNPDQVTVVGGPRLAASFLKEKMIDELWLTIEPRIFGEGISLVYGERLDIRLELISCEKANEQGTLFLKYTVLK